MQAPRWAPSGRSQRPGRARPRVARERVAADLVPRDEPAESIVAFTFTEKAAEELKDRIRQQLTSSAKTPATSSASSMCAPFTVLGCSRCMCRSTRFYTPVVGSRSVDLLYREGTRLKLKQFGEATAARVSPTSFGASTSLRTSFSTPTNCTRQLP